LDQLNRALARLASIWSDSYQVDVEQIEAPYVREMLQQVPLNGERTRHMAGEIERLVGTAMQHLDRGGAPESGNWNLSRLDRLSNREREILVALAEGETVQQIAHRLSRSPKTINNHRTHVLHKLGLRNSAQLARFAIAAGLIEA